MHLVGRQDMFHILIRVMRHERESQSLVPDVQTSRVPYLFVFVGIVFKGYVYKIEKNALTIEDYAILLNASDGIRDEIFIHGII